MESKKVIASMTSTVKAKTKRRQKIKSLRKGLTWRKLVHTHHRNQGVKKKNPGNPEAMSCLIARRRRGHKNKVEENDLLTL